MPQTYQGTVRLDREVPHIDQTPLQTAGSTAERERIDAIFSDAEIGQQALTARLGKVAFDWGTAILPHDTSFVRYDHITGE